jgi:hypothetical protein
MGRRNNMTPYKLGWKVVFSDKGKLTSCSLRWNGEVEYKFGKKTVPNKGCGPLCVFTNKNDAKNFCVSNKEQIYPCAYIPSKEKRIWDTGPFSASRSIKDLPKGKALASEVILLKERRIK